MPSLSDSDSPGVAAVDAQPEVIEPTSSPESEEEYVVPDSEDEGGSLIVEEIESTPLSRSGSKRKASADDEEPSAQNDSPTTKRPKLSLHVKTPSSPAVREKGASSAAAVAAAVPAAGGRSTAQDTTTPGPQKGKHIVFGDDSPAEFFTPMEAPAHNPLGAVSVKRPEKIEEADEQVDERKEERGDDGEEGSDDDEAPEAISSSKPISDPRRSAQAAAAKLADQ